MTIKAGRLLKIDFCSEGDRETGRFLFYEVRKMIEVTCDTKDTLDLDELETFQGGLKLRQDQDVNKIIRSIKEHGFAVPFFVWQHDGKNSVLDGHGRLLALHKMQNEGEEIPPLPVVYIDAKNEQEAKKLLLKICSQYGEMTTDSVLDFLDGIEVNFEDLALPADLIDFSKLMDEDETDDDEVPEVDEEEEPDSKPGEIYQLGPHRLLCGDSTDPEALALLMDGRKADLIVTDPPYNVDLAAKNNFLNMADKGGRLQKPIINDKMSDSKFIEFLTTVFQNMLDNMKAGGAFYIWYANIKSYEFETALKNAGGKIRQYLIWVKQLFNLGMADYQWRHEPCLYGWKEGASHYWEGRRDLTTVIDKKKNYKNMSKEELLKELNRIDAEIKTTILYEDKPSRSAEHPTMKPVNLYARLIRNSSKEEDLVLDVFGGSGTAVIAAAKLNRTAYVMELDPHYCDVIRKRWTIYAQEHGLDAGSGALE